ncbi:MAG: hypothetical protein LC676_18225 [Loktanella sp.]|nr:hypothetical protein [Loktanella sp.]
MPLVTSAEIAAMNLVSGDSAPAVSLSGRREKTKVSSRFMPRGKAQAKGSIPSGLPWRAVRGMVGACVVEISLCSAGWHNYRVPTLAKWKDESTTSNFNLGFADNSWLAARYSLFLLSVQLFF